MWIKVQAKLLTQKQIWAYYLDMSKPLNHGKTFQVSLGTNKTEDKEDSSKRYRKPHATEGYKLRKQIAITYALLFIPLGHYMMQTRVYGLSGAVSKYAIFEWLAIILDIAFDGVAMKEFNGLELKVLAYPYPSHYNGSLGDEKDENLDEDKTVSSSQKEHMERYFAWSILKILEFNNNAICFW